MKQKKLLNVLVASALLTSLALPTWMDPITVGVASATTLQKVTDAEGDSAAKTVVVTMEEAVSQTGTDLEALFTVKKSAADATPVKFTAANDPANKKITLTYTGDLYEGAVVVFNSTPKDITGLEKAPKATPSVTNATYEAKTKTVSVTFSSNPTGLIADNFKITNNTTSDKLSVENVNTTGNVATFTLKGDVPAGTYTVKVEGPAEGSTNFEVPAPAASVTPAAPTVTVATYIVTDSTHITFTMNDNGTLVHHEHVLTKALEPNVETNVEFTYKGKSFSHPVTYSVKPANNSSSSNSSSSDGYSVYSSSPSSTSSSGSGSTSSNSGTTNATTENDKKSSTSNTDKTKQEDRTTTSNQDVKTPSKSVQKRSSAPTFSDLQKHSWASESIKFLSSKGIIAGTGAGKFSPAAKVTHGQMEVFMQRLFNNPKPGFLKQIVSSMKKKQAMTRQDVMIMIHKAMIANGMKLNAGQPTALAKVKVNKNAKAAIASLIAEGIISKDVSKLKPTQSVSRAEVATFLKRVYDKVKVNK